MSSCATILTSVLRICPLLADVAEATMNDQQPMVNFS
jgi:hypothetical protein